MQVVFFIITLGTDEKKTAAGRIRKGKYNVIVS